MDFLEYVSVVALVVLLALAVVRIVVGERDVESWGEVRAARSVRVRSLDLAMVITTAVLMVALVVHLWSGLS